MLVLWLLALVIALAPGGALLWYIRHMDKYEPEPWKTMGIVFAVGCISVVPAFITEFILRAYTPAGFLGTVYHAFIVAAITEELWKGGFTLGAVWKKPDFNEILDGMVYFGVGHMGFALTENLKYVFIDSGGNVAQGLMNAFVRSTTAVPLHVTVGMIMGYHVGMARYSNKRSDRIRHAAEALGIPILLHGFYDLAAFNQNIQVIDLVDLLRLGFGSALMYAAVVALWLFLLPRVQKAQDASPWKPQEWPSLPAAPSTCPYCGSSYPLGANYCHMCGTSVLQEEGAAHSVPMSADTETSG